MAIFHLSDRIDFPPPMLAENGGLLAVGGDLSRERLVSAYESGIFPWYMAGEPILWWSPDPRLVLYPPEFRLSRSLKKVINKGVFHITLDTAFVDVIQACAFDRLENGEKTWITPEMLEAYVDLFHAGYAHSVEAWQGNTLAGGLYGVSLGRSFFGESMFTRVPNASKTALYFLAAYLNQRNFDMIDCQNPTDHLKRLGAREITRKQFLMQLEQSLKRPSMKGPWTV